MASVIEVWGCLFSIIYSSHSSLDNCRCYYHSKWWRHIFNMCTTIYLKVLAQDSLWRECRAPPSWDLLTFPRPLPWWDPLIWPLWSCVTRLRSGPCETHHAVPGCAEWLILKLVWGCNYPFSSRSLRITKHPQHGSLDCSAAGFWHMIRMQQECKSVCYCACVGQQFWVVIKIFIDEDRCKHTNYFADHSSGYCRYCTGCRRVSQSRTSRRLINTGALTGEFPPVYVYSLPQIVTSVLRQWKAIMFLKKGSIMQMVFWWRSIYSLKPSKPSPLCSFCLPCF